MNKIILFILLLISTTVTATEKNLIFNRPEDSPEARYIIALLEKAYKQLGYNIHIIDFNHQNALDAANDGILDGQLARISDISKQYPNLQKVDFPVFEFQLLLLKNCFACSYQQLDSLAVQSSYPAALSYIENNPTDAAVIKVKSITSQLNLLTQKKVEGGIILDYLLATKHPDFSASAFQAETLTTLTGFHFLHKKHAALIPQLKAELQKLEVNGSLKVLQAKYLH